MRYMIQGYNIFSLNLMTYLRLVTHRQAFCQQWCQRTSGVLSSPSGLMCSGGRAVGDNWDECVVLGVELTDCQPRVTQCLVDELTALSVNSAAPVQCGDNVCDVGPTLSRRWWLPPVLQAFSLPLWLSTSRVYLSESSIRRCHSITHHMTYSQRVNYNIRY